MHILYRINFDTPPFIGLLDYSLPERALFEGALFAVQVPIYFKMNKLF
ncbi:hypothetical protein FORC60_3874 [Bacillus cereus]|nr:hypothetical protein FORC60_3874 [Bacillus cereus]